MNPNVVAVPHFEEDVVTVGVFRARDEVALEDLAGLAGNADETADLSTCLPEMIEDFAMISFQFGRC